MREPGEQLIPATWQPVVKAPTLLATEPHVWLVDLQDHFRLADSLDATERAKADRLADPRTRDRWVRTHLALRMILGAYLDTDALAVQFELDARGKPRVVQHEGNDGTLMFSLSHAEDIALVAVALDAPLGVDVECVRPFPEMTSVIAQHFSEMEQAELVDVEPSDAVCAFYRCWTRKEAVLKSLGIGLHAPLPSLSVQCAPTMRPRVNAISCGDSPANSWSLVHLDPCRGYVGALATTGVVSDVRLMRWTT